MIFIMAPSRLHPKMKLTASESVCSQYGNLGFCPVIETQEHFLSNNTKSSEIGYQKLQTNVS